MHSDFSSKYQKSAILPASHGEISVIVADQLFLPSSILLSVWGAIRRVFILISELSEFHEKHCSKWLGCQT